MKFLLDRRATSSVEWLIVAALIALVVAGGALITVFESIRDKLLEVNDAL